MFSAAAVTVTMSMPVASAMAFSVAVAFFFAAFAVIAAAAFALLFVTVTAAALFCMAVVSVAAASTLFVAMTMAVMVAAAGCGGFNVVFKCADERGDGSITVAFVAGIKPDVGLCQRLHGARSEAAADHAVDGVLYEKVHHGGVTVAACGNRFGRNDGSVLHNIDLEVGRHAEVLEDGVVFDGHRDFHM